MSTILPLDLQPTLVGKMLMLRPLREADYQALYGVASDPLIWEQHPSSDRWQESVFGEFFREAVASGGALVAIEGSSGSIIGSSRFHNYDPAAKTIEIGWTFLARAYWGGTYNTEMKRLMMSHVAPFVERIQFFVGKTNMRSQRAIEKLGCVRIGETQDELGRQSYVYEITPRQASSMAKR